MATNNLSTGGIDTAVFKAHSTRATLTSAAVLAGASMKDIMDYTRQGGPVSPPLRISIISWFSDLLQSSDLLFTRVSLLFTWVFLTYTVMYTALPQRRINGLMRPDVETRILRVAGQVHDSVIFPPPPFSLTVSSNSPS